jgi:hypothetical protein
MPCVIDLGSQRASLDIASYGRCGPGRQRSLGAAEVAHAVRTARGAPEVVVKVSGGARTTRGVGSNLDYIGREGEQEIETAAPSSARSLRVASRRSWSTTWSHLHFCPQTSEQVRKTHRFPDTGLATDRKNHPSP